MAVAPGFCAKYQNDAHLVVNHEAGEKPVALNAMRDATYSGCRTIDLRKADSCRSVRIIEGLGYDGFVVKLGEDETLSPDVPEIVYELDSLKGDSVTLHVFHLPFFPLYEGGRCRFGVSVDSGEEQVREYIPREWSAEWKENVLRNSEVSSFTMPLTDVTGSHKLRIRGIDPGLVIQRVVIDEGGFKPGYVGPDL